MKIKSIRVMAAIIAALTVTARAQADEGSVALPFLRIDQNPQSAAMGGVSLWSNAASTARIENHGHAMASYQKWTLNPSDFISFDAAYRIAGRYGIRMAVTSQSESPYDLMGDNGEQLGQFTPGAIRATLGMSCAIGDHFSVGADMHYANRTVAENCNYGAFAGDLAVMAVFEGFSASVGGKCLGTSVKSIDGTLFSLPSSLYASCGYEYGFAESHNIAAAVDLEYFLYGAVSVSAGLRYTFMDMISAMGGYHAGGIIADHASAGIGLDIKGLCLNATCLLGQSDIKGTLIFGLGYRF